MDIVTRTAGEALLVRLTPIEASVHVYCLVSHSHPEVVAMLQALYSRSPKSITTRVDVLTAEKAAPFMAQYYTGYGHASIGDCGQIVLFIEGVSMPVAKAIQDTPLYNGQEASTRYMDMSKAVVANPLGTEAGAAVQQTWMDFYFRAQEPMKAHLREQYPLQEGEEAKTYERAINARAFDILRGFLPAGVSTMLSWSTNLRIANDHLRKMELHPNPLVRTFAETTLAGLRELFPSSFEKPWSEEVRLWMREQLTCATELEFRVERFRFGSRDWNIRDAVEVTNTIDQTALVQGFGDLFERRPRGALITVDTNPFGTIEFQGWLDYGSFRDLQRHRACRIRVPTLRVDGGFHSWYLDQLPSDLRKEAVSLEERQKLAIRQLGGQSIRRESYIAMGYKIPVIVHGPLHAIVYLLELRTRPDVHSTLRMMMQDAAMQLAVQLSEIKIHANHEPDTWSLRRGTHTIINQTTGKAVGEE